MGKVSVSLTVVPKLLSYLWYHKPLHVKETIISESKVSASTLLIKLNILWPYHLVNMLLLYFYIHKLCILAARNKVKNFPLS